MSLVATRIKNENENPKALKICGKKIVGNSNENIIMGNKGNNTITNRPGETKRTALCDINNKTSLKSNNVIKSELNQIEKAAVIKGNNFQSIKPRVDTWNKLTRKPLRANVITTGPITNTTQSSSSSVLTSSSSVVPPPTTACPTLVTSSILTTQTNQQTVRLVKTSVHTVKVEVPKKITIPSKGPITRSNENLHQQQQQQQQENSVRVIPTQVVKRTESNVLSRRTIQKFTSVNNTNINNNNTTTNNNVVGKECKSNKLTEPDSTTINVNGAGDDQTFVDNKITSHSAKLYTVENVDLNDNGNPLLVSEYVNDIYAYLSHLELKYPIVENHLFGQREVTHKMRSVLIDWLNEVHYQFRLETETFFMTVSIIDRYLQIVKTVSRQNLQLVGITALFIASKYEELYPPELKDFAYITDDTYNKRQILEMEKFILKRLHFNLSRPLPIHFLRRYSKAAGTHATVHLMAKYFIELASIDYGFVHYRPSEIAAASLSISLTLLSNNKDTNGYNNKINGNVGTSDGSSASGGINWSQTLEHYSKYSKNHLKPIVNKLAELIQNIPKSKYKAVHLKYALEKFESIANRTELKDDHLQQIIDNTK